MWIIFEGLDKSGKGTLEYALLKRTSYKHIVIDRGPVGYLVFDDVFNRGTKCSKQNFIHQARKIMKTKDFLVVYCKAPIDVVSQRLESHGERFEYDYCKAQKIYDGYIKRFYNDEYVLTLDTTQSVDDCIDKIIEKLQEVCHERY